MSQSFQADLCVIGGGLAGLSAATRAAQLGLRVRLLEQSPEAHYLCNSRMTNGIFHMALKSPAIGADALERAIAAASRGTAHPELQRALAENALRAVRWLQSCGVRFMKASAEPHHAFSLAPPALHRTGPFDILGRAGDVMLRRLEAAFLAAGGTLHRGLRATELIVQDGECRGVRGEGFEVHTQGVVIADGGFQANPELVKQFNLSPKPEQILQRNARTARGDGLKMAVKAGAQLSQMRGFYGHLQCRDALNNETLWPYPWIDLIAVASIVIGPDGCRFMDEGRGGVYMANRIAEQAQPAGSFVVFDHAIWNGPGAAYLKPPNPRLVQRGGTLLQAQTLQELAQAMGVPTENLEREVQTYNAAFASNSLGEMDPVRTVGAKPAHPILTAPFYAVPLVAGMTHTMGGIAIDGWSRASTADGQPFPGLYAAGTCTGGIEGGEHAGYVSGLTRAAVTGMRAAEHAAQRLAEIRQQSQR
jgi:fumarate reductase flavoprotein subunit